MHYKKITVLSLFLRPKNGSKCFEQFILSRFENGSRYRELKQGLSRFNTKTALIRAVLDPKTAQTGLSCFCKKDSNRFEPFRLKQLKQVGVVLRYKNDS